MHRDLQHSAETIVQHFHLNPASLRLTEAWGLWRQRRWAEWLGALSGGINLPSKIFELADGENWIKLSVFAINVLCVLLLVNALRAGNKPAARHDSQ